MKQFMMRLYRRIKCDAGLLVLGTILCLPFIVETAFMPEIVSASTTIITFILGIIIIFAAYSE